MNSELFYDELVKRYMYLYENKELILAMCIRRINIDDKLYEQIESYKEYKKRLMSVDKHLFDDLIKSIKDQLGIEKFYLSANVSKKIVNAYEEFLFTDGSIEDTAIYKHVEALKKSDVYMDSVNNMISCLNERRSCNQWLKRIPTFTVWKILGYVRRKNENNSVALDALDKYYNIDRTVMTGMDSECGYKLFGEECEDDERLMKYPDMTLLSGVPGSYIIFNYSPNEYEIEDDYFSFESVLDEDEVLSGEAKTIFMDMLSKLPNLSFDKKFDIYNELNNSKKLTL